MRVWWTAVLGDGLKTGVFTEADKQAYIEAWSQPGALTGGLNYYRAANLGPPTPGAPAAPAADAGSMMVKVPTLVIWGEKDTALLTGNLDGMDKFVPNLTIKRIPDGSHWVIHEKPGVVNQLHSRVHQVVWNCHGPIPIKRERKAPLEEYAKRDGQDTAAALDKVSGRVSGMGAPGLCGIGGPHAPGRIVLTFSLSASTNTVL